MFNFSAKNAVSWLAVFLLAAVVTPDLDADHQLWHRQSIHFDACLVHQPELQRANDRQPKESRFCCGEISKIAGLAGDQAELDTNLQSVLKSIAHQIVQGLVASTEALGSVPYEFTTGVVDLDLVVAESVDADLTGGDEYWDYYNDCDRWNVSFGARTLMPFRKTESWAKKIQPAVTDRLVWLGTKIQNTHYYFFEDLGGQLARFGQTLDAHLLTLAASHQSLKLDQKSMEASNLLNVSKQAANGILAEIWANMRLVKSTFENAEFGSALNWAESMALPLYRELERSIRCCGDRWIMSTDDDLRPWLIRLENLHRFEF